MLVLFVFRKKKKIKIKIILIVFCLFFTKLTVHREHTYPKCPTHKSLLLSIVYVIYIILHIVMCVCIQYKCTGIGTPIYIYTSTLYTCK